MLILPELYDKIVSGIESKNDLSLQSIISQLEDAYSNREFRKANVVKYYISYQVY